MEKNIFEAQDPSKYLEELNEEELIYKVIIPLFQRYNWRLVKKSKHREGELGKDIVFKVNTDFGENFYAIQLKAQRINNSNVMSIINQVEIALSTPITDLNKDVYVSFVFVITSKNITNDAERILKEKFKSNPNIRFFDKDKLLDMVTRISRIIPLLFLKPINEILNENISCSSELIRFCGPNKEDFENKNIIKRAEVNHVLQSINNGSKAILIKGHSASGKTVLVHNVAYILSKTRNVYLINANDISTENLNNVISEIRYIEITNPLIIIEDLHKNSSNCNILYRYLLSKRLLVIFTSRPGYEVDFPRKDKNLIKDLENRPNVTFFEITSDSLITPLIEKKFGKKSDEFFENLAKVSGGDLWLLTYFLASIKDDKVEKEQVLRYIHDDFLSIEKSNPNSLKILITLSFFYRYEIQVEKEYLVDLLGIEYSTINALLKDGYILEDSTKDFCFIRHSSIADLFVETGRKFRNIVSISKQLNTDEDEVETILFENYLKFNPSMIFLFVQRFRYNNQLLEFLITRESTKRIIFKIINNIQQENEKVAGFLSDFTRISSEKVRSEVEKQINKELYAKRINEEKKLETIGHLINCLPWDIKLTGQLLINESNVFVEEMMKDFERDNDIKMGYCDWNIEWGTKSDIILNLKTKFKKYKSGKELDWKIIDLNHFVFCSKFFHARKIYLCSKSLFCDSSQVLKEILQFVDINLLAKKIDNDSDLYNISHIINNIYWSDNFIGTMLISLIDNNIIREKISEETSLANASFLIWNLGKSLDSKKLAILVNDIKDEQIKERLFRYDLIWK